MKQLKQQGDTLRVLIERGGGWPGLKERLRRDPDSKRAAHRPSPGAVRTPPMCSCSGLSIAISGSH